MKKSIRRTVFFFKYDGNRKMKNKYLHDSNTIRREYCCANKKRNINASNIKTNIKYVSRTVIIYIILVDR